jgi:HEAT repeat protein
LKLVSEALNDSSQRVVNAAANALGKSKSPKAFDALVKLKDKPSWKSQSLIAALNGLKELGDPRGVAIAYEALANVQLPRWHLATHLGLSGRSSRNTVAFG